MWCGWCVPQVTQKTGGSEPLIFVVACGAGFLWLGCGVEQQTDTQKRMVMPWQSAGTPFCCFDASTAVSAEGMEGGAAAGMLLLASSDANSNMRVSTNG